VKIAIGIPSTDMVHADFAMSLALVVSNARECKHEVALINQKTSIIEKGRYEIVEAAKALKADALFFMDSDMVFPPDILVTLLSSGKEIIGCNYTTRRPPIRVTCRDINGKFVNYGFTTVQEVGYIGTGCLLIDMKVFDKLNKPYFRVEYDKEKGFISEDYCFCEDARKNGFKIHCDFGLSRNIKHIGSSTYAI